MTIEDHISIRGTAFSFKFLRPRIAAGILIIILLCCPWFIVYPESFDGKPYYGRGASIDATIRASPTSIRIAICIGLEIYLFYVLYAYYIPCIRDASLMIVYRRQLNGIGFWGQKESMQLSAAQSVAFRNGGAFVKGEGKAIWIPLSLLDITAEQRREIEAVLKFQVE